MAKYKLFSLSNKLKLVYINENGHEFNLGFFKRKVYAERKMRAHRKQMNEYRDFYESFVAKAA